MSCMVTEIKLQCTCFFKPRNEIEYQPDQTKRVLLLLLLLFKEKYERI